MAKGEVLVRMKADVSNYDANIAKARKQLQSFKEDNLTMGGIMKQTTGSIVAAAAQYASFAAVLGTVASGFAEAVSKGTEMAREMEGVKMAFDRINQPGLLENLRKATHNTVNDLELMKQAVKFDNFNLSIDQMGTFLAFAQQQAKDTGQDVNYLVDSIVTGLGRKSLPILDNLGLSAEEIKNRMKETGDMTTAVAQIIQERMEAAGGYVETAADRSAKATADVENAMMDLGKVFAPLTESANSFFSAIQIGAIKALTYIGKLMNTLSGAGRAANVASGEDANIQKGLGKLRVAKAAGSDYMVKSLYNGQVESYNRRINDYDAQIKNGGKRPGAGSGESRDIRWLQAQRDGLVIARDQYIQQAEQIMNPIVNNTTVDTGGGKGGGKGGKTFNPASIAFNANKAALAAVKPEDITGPSQAWEAYTSSLASSFEEPLSPLQQLNKELAEMKANLENAPDTQSYQQGLSLIAEKEKEIAKFKGETKTVDIAKDTEDAWKDAANAMAQVGSAMESIEDPTAKTVGIVMKAIATVAQAFMQALSEDNTTKGNIWAFIAAAAASTASMIGVISSIHSATGYAQGGIVTGNAYSGDQIPIRANAGEVVLTRAMSGNLASQLEGNGLGNLNLTATIKGEQIKLALNNNGRRTGKGEFVQSNSR